MEEKKKKTSAGRSPSSILPQSPIAYEQYKSWCSGSLLGLLRFKQGQSNKKRISVKAHGNGNSKNQPDLLHGFRDKCQCTDDMAQANKAKKVSFSRMQRVKHDSKPVEAPLKGERQTKKVDDKVISSKCKLISETISAEKSSEDSSEASENMEDDKWSFKCLGDYRSKHFINALDILSSNRDLFIELLQDPVSLSQKHTQNSRKPQQEDPRAKSSSNSGLIDPRDKLDKQADCRKSDQNIDLKPGSKNMRLKDKKQELELGIRFSNNELQFPAADCASTKFLSSNNNEDGKETEISSIKEAGKCSPETISMKDSSHMESSETASNEFIGAGSSLSVTSRELHTFKENAKRVSEATGLDWTEFFSRFTLSSDPSPQQKQLMDELSAETWRNQSTTYDNHKVSSSYIDEVAAEVYGGCLKSYPCVSLMNQTYLPLVLMKDLVKRLERRLVCDEPPPPSSLDRITQKDMAGSWSWMDLRSDTDDVVAEMVELFLQDLGIEMANELNI